MSGIKSSLTKVSSLLLVALGFFSCQDTITLEGEGIISGEAFDTNQATFNVFVTNKSVAAVQTNKLPLYQLGHFNHPVYGKTSASVATQLRLQNSQGNPTFGFYTQENENTATTRENETVTAAYLYLPFLLNTRADSDLDGLADIYLTGNMVANKLYLNKGNLTFEDISISAGIEGNKPWSTGVVMVDINQDGLLDIYVSNAGNLKGNNHDNDLYINNGDLTFTEKAAEFNLAKTGFSTHASFFDYDKDGDLDAYILNNSNIPVSSLGYAEQRDKRAQDWANVPEIFRGVGDMLLRNDNGKFVDVSEQAGIYGSLIGFGLGVDLRCSKFIWFQDSIKVWQH